VNSVLHIVHDGLFVVTIIVDWIRL